VNRPGRGKRASIYLSLSEAEWVALWEHQGGACAGCGDALMNRYDPMSVGGKIAYVDHCHEREKTVGLRASIRGLLCVSCNRHRLPPLQDSPGIAERLARYLRNPPAHEVIRAGD